MPKLGTNTKPAIVRVQSQERANEILQICEENDWKVIVGIEVDKEEDISDVYKLLGYKVENTKTIIKDEVVGRNDPCLCGSGKKYKKCCGK
ncbi:PBPRA1643 family SWIM/SEC-C metal-binding motif protein [Anaerosolibacter sp.]|uniref:PBPRA1643 family SWIM/SEC-C metal-binding motif protein n=1 Tax=Anaerosolibacter sp. TaxID=1872527 RepID=UPI0039EF08A3